MMRPVNSLALIFDPANMEKLASCGVHFLDAPTEMIPAALKYIGEDPDAQDAETIEKAEPVLTAIAPLCAEVPQFGIHQRTGKWRYLRGVRLVRRRAAGA